MPQPVRKVVQLELQGLVVMTERSLAEYGQILPAAERTALERPNVQRHLDGKQVLREIVVPGRLVNFVIR